MRKNSKIKRVKDHRPLVNPRRHKEKRWVDGSGHAVPQDFGSSDARGFECTGCFDPDTWTISPCGPGKQCWQNSDATMWFDKTA